MKASWWGVGVAGVLFAGAPAALAHELECEKTVNGARLVELDHFPATLNYELTVRNIHQSEASDVLDASDPLLTRLGWEGFATPFTLPLNGEAKERHAVKVKDLAQCLELAAMDGTQDTVIDNIFTVRWDNGSDVCSAKVECVPPAPPPPDSKSGMRMTGGGSMFTADGMRVTHGFQLRCDASDPRQNLQVNWGPGNRFHLLSVSSVTCVDTELEEAPPVAGFDTLSLTGTGRYNGIEGATVELTFTDDGEPGVDDTGKLVIRDADGNVVLEVESTLQFGNHQAHGR